MIRRLLSCFVTALLWSAMVAGQTLAPSPVFTGFDATGHIVPAGKLCTYVAGSTTAVATYADTALTLNANPVILDGAGRARIYLLPGHNYKFVLRTAGTDQTCATGSVLWSQDNIAAVPSSNNVDVLGTAGETLSAGQVVYLSDGSGGTTAGRWYKAKASASSMSTDVVIGMTPSAITASEVGLVRLAGIVTGLTTTAGYAYYISASTFGAIVTSIPATFPRLVGIADSSTSIVLASAPPQSGPPTGMVSFFNLAACPLGWTEYTAARGLYVVGKPSGGTLAGSPTGQTALTDKENRPVGQHTHTATIGLGTDSGTLAGLNAGRANTGVAQFNAGITIANDGTTAGTNAPYIQLLACVKQ